MKNREEFDLSVFGGGWRVVVWSWVENQNGNVVLLQSIDRSESWLFIDMAKAFAFCFDNGLVPVDEFGSWEDSGDLNAGLGESEPVPLIAWRRYWKKEVKDVSEALPEFHCPDWKG